MRNKRQHRYLTIHSLEVPKGGFVEFERPYYIWEWKKNARKRQPSKHIVLDDGTFSTFTESTLKSLKAHNRITIKSIYE